MTGPSKAMKIMEAKGVGAKAVSLEEAISVLKKFPARKFDQTVEIHVRLGIDAAQADQIVRGSLV